MDTQTNKLETVNLKLIGKHRTKISTDSDGELSVRYHATNVFTFNPSTGIIKLDSGGWHTVTTKKRINQCFAAFDLPYTLHQKNFDWFVDHLPTGDVYPFRNDMRVYVGVQA